MGVKYPSRIASVTRCLSVLSNLAYGISEINVAHPLAIGVLGSSGVLLTASPPLTSEPSVTISPTGLESTPPVVVGLRSEMGLPDISAPLPTSVLPLDSGSADLIVVSSFVSFQV